ncbi:helicase C-terminal domain-containing protein [Paenibacillus lautus]|uniref:helicase C-terminal domain-containing protein n=1 Tax=Paenibacillus lautus TaxID=1401 RepID=UPI003D2B1E99
MIITSPYPFFSSITIETNISTKPFKSKEEHYFSSTGKNGNDYAYVYPVNKVLQAGGRLIRSEQESGILMLVDDRYLQAMYRSLLPEESREYEVLEMSRLPIIV